MQTIEQQIRATLIGLKERIAAHDKKLDDPHGDGTGRDATPPTGDDYNELLADVQSTLDAALALLNDRTPA